MWCTSPNKQRQHRSAGWTRYARRCFRRYRLTGFWKEQRPKFKKLFNYMNLHRYKAKMPSNGYGDLNNEYIGTWIFFGGLIALIFHLVFDSNTRNAVETAAYVVGTMYAFHWFGARHKSIFLIFTLLTFSIAILILQGALSQNSLCIEIEDQRRLARCLQRSSIWIVWGFYTLSVFFVCIMYIFRLSKKTV